MLDELTIADPPEAWREAGFEPDGDLLEVGSMRLRLAGPEAGRGIVGWSLSGLYAWAGNGVDPGAADRVDTTALARPAAATLDGLRTAAADRTPCAGAPQPNGVTGVDHVVAFTPDLDRTTAALREAGLDFRRLREEPTPGGAPRQAFFRLGDVILEVVQAPKGTRVAADPDGPARLWGISFGVEDLDATAAFLGDRLGEPRDAVQPGRRIATLRREAGLGPAVAFMS